MAHDGHAGVFKGAEALADAFDVVVVAAGRLAAVQEPVEQDLLGRVEEEGEAGGHDDLFEFEGLVHFAGEAWTNVSDD